MAIRRIDKTRLKKRADVLFARWIKHRDGKCVRCGRQSGYQLQCAHIISRSNLRLRYDPLNAITLCAACHMWWHHNPFDSTEWYKTTHPKDWKYLSKERLVVEKPDYEVIIKSLNEMLDVRYS